MNIEIANRLVELRKKNGYTQEQLADKLGLSRQAVSKWERAESSPDTDNLICLAKLYGVSLDELLNTEQPVEEIIEQNKERTKEEEKANQPQEENNKEEPQIEEGEENEKKSGNGSYIQGSWESQGNQAHVYFEDDEVHYKDGKVEYTRKSSGSKRGSKVHLGQDGIIITSDDEEDGEVKVHLNHDGISISDPQDANVYIKKHSQPNGFKVFMEILWPLSILLSVAGYIVFGFLYDQPSGIGWACGWTIILYGIVLPSLFEAIGRRKFTKFNMFFLVIGLYCGFGIWGSFNGMNYWHPYWVVLFIIPIYYCVFGEIDNYLRRKRFLKTGVFEEEDEDDD